MYSCVMYIIYKQPNQSSAVIIVNCCQIKQYVIYLSMLITKKTVPISSNTNKRICITDSVVIAEKGFLKVPRFIFK